MSTYTDILRRRARLVLLTLALAGASPAFAGPPTAGETPIRLSSNENAFGPSPKAVAAMKAVLDSGNYYNRNETDTLIELAAARERVATDYILPTAGSGPVLEMTAAAYAQPGKNVVTVAPGYPQLTGAFVRFGGDIKYVSVGPNKGYDFPALRRAIDDNTVIVYICNPNNPTGMLADPGELRKFILSVPQHVLVFVDEAYLELSDTGLMANTAAPLVKVRKNLIISRTFSKAFGLAGYRAGYGLSHPDTLAKLRKFYQGGPSYLAAVAASAALQDTGHLEENRQKYIAVRKMVLAEFDRMGIQYCQPDGAFILFNSTVDSGTFQAKMNEEGILVSRPFGLGEEKGWDTWVRVSIGTSDQMQTFLGAMNKILGKT